VVSAGLPWCYSRRALAALLSLFVFVGAVGMSYQVRPDACAPEQSTRLDVGHG
jgi:hypothetical protein